MSKAFKERGCFVKILKNSLEQGWGNFCKSKAAFQITGNQLGSNLKQQYTQKNLTCIKIINNLKIHKSNFTAFDDYSEAVCQKLIMRSLVPTSLILELVGLPSEHLLYEISSDSWFLLCMRMLIHSGRLYQSMITLSSVLTQAWIFHSIFPYFNRILLGVEQRF